MVAGGLDHECEGGCAVLLCVLTCFTSQGLSSPMSHPQDPHLLPWFDSHGLGHDQELIVTAPSPRLQATSQTCNISFLVDAPCRKSNDIDQDNRYFNLKTASDEVSQWGEVSNLTMLDIRAAHTSSSWN